MVATMKVKPCPECGTPVPIVKPAHFFWRKKMTYARHAVGPLVEIASGYWRRLPCFGSGRDA